ncbi:MAG: alkaline phosphatase, partial [Planctomycetota bacterium]|nr:alkaline phosphatase [Planctomycetota bacterium]
MPRLSQKYYGLERRKFLQMMATVTALPSLSHLSASCVLGSAKFSDNPFALGVASGDPEPHGVVIW